MWMLIWESACCDAQAGPTLRLDSANQLAIGTRLTNTSIKILPRIYVYCNVLSILAVSVILLPAHANLNAQLARYRTHLLFSACNLALMATMRTTSLVSAWQVALKTQPPCFTSIDPI